jgi:hypothetical protein
MGSMVRRPRRTSELELERGGIVLIDIALLDTFVKKNLGGRGTGAAIPTGTAAFLVCAEGVREPVPMR